MGGWVGWFWEDWYLNMEPLSLGGVRAGGGFSLEQSLAGLTLGSRELGQRSQVQLLTFN